VLGVRNPRLLPDCLDRQWLKDLMNKYASNVIVDAMQEFIGPSDPSTESGRVTWATAASKRPSSIALNRFLLNPLTRIYDAQSYRIKTLALSAHITVYFLVNSISRRGHRQSWQ